jgi:hypothetical protein
MYYNRKISTMPEQENQPREYITISRETQTDEEAARMLRADLIQVFSDITNGYNPNDREAFDELVERRSEIPREFPFFEEYVEAKRLAGKDWSQGAATIRKEYPEIIQGIDAIVKRLRTGELDRILEVKDWEDLGKLKKEIMTLLHNDRISAPPVDRR